VPIVEEAMMQGVRFLARPAVFSGLAVLAIAGAVFAGLPRAIGADADPSNTGVTHTDDLVMARQLLMDSNETAMMPIDRAAAGENIDLAILKNAAYTIYTALSVAPHLFPSSTKPVIGKDGSSTPSTAASTKIWDDFGAFYDQFTESANLAYDMSQAKDVAAFRTGAKQLRVDCDSCHAKNMNVYDPTKQP
jgi:cytochrome c556